MNVFLFTYLFILIIHPLILNQSSIIASSAPSPGWACPSFYLELDVLYQVTFYLNLPFVAVIKQLGMERVYFIFIFTVHHQGKPKQKLKARIWKLGLKQTVEERCLLACSPGPPTHGIVMTTLDCTFPHQLHFKKMPRQTLPQASLM